MAYVDDRGAQLDRDIAASAGIYDTVTVEATAGTPFDLTGYTVQCVIKDDQEQSRDYGGEFGSETTYTMTVTDAANGIFDFIIPSSQFKNKEGGQLTYELYYIDSNSNRDALMWGYINVQERG